MLGVFTDFNQFRMRNLVDKYSNITYWQTKLQKWTGHCIPQMHFRYIHFQPGGNRRDVELGRPNNNLRCKNKISFRFWCLHSLTPLTNVLIWVRSGKNIYWKLEFARIRIDYTNSRDHLEWKWCCRNFKMFIKLHLHSRCFVYMNSETDERIKSDRVILHDNMSAIKYNIEM